MAAVDLNNGVQATYDSVSKRLFAITPHDTNELAYLTKGLYVGSTGDVKVTDANDIDTVIPNCPAGLILPIRVKRVFSTGTTASGLVGMA